MNITEESILNEVMWSLLFLSVTTGLLLLTFENLSHSLKRKLLKTETPLKKLNWNCGKTINLTA